jgi:AcrR family transcriptional regulator
MVVSIANNVSTRARGVATQNRILEKAVHIASIEGLESMSLATLAKATSMSKSGLFAHFRSKEALQIAIIDEAERIFQDVVVRPAEATPAGVARLTRLAEGYIEYCSGGPFQGGCFFAAAAHEFDGRPGAVRDRVVQFFDAWHTTIRNTVAEAAKRGEIRSGVDVESFIFELTAVGLAANHTTQIGGGAERAANLARESLTALLEKTTAAN